MAIHFFAEETTFQLRCKRRMAAWMQRIIEEEYCRQTGNICVIFCSDDYLLQLNRQYLHHDYFTDVITFDYSDESILSGDIFVSIDEVRRNAKRYGVAADEELRRVVIHGILHLCGIGDHSPTEKITMQRSENRCLAQWQE